ncbi:hypothetical protein ACT2CC_00235 [Candidatus Vidania fulgoroideorum]
MLNILKKIVNDKLIELKHRKKKISLLKIKKIFLRYVNNNNIIYNNIIGEIKFFTPINGKISQTKNIDKIINIYKKVKIRILSILTEKIHFAGNISYIPIIKSKIKYRKYNLLRKDFIIDIYQLYESIVIGSDILLIIVYILKINIIKNILKFNIKIILEIFSEIDIKKVSNFNCFKNLFIGINSRNLRDASFKNKNDLINMSLYIENKNIIIESGVKKIKEIFFFKRINFGLLIGEFFIKLANEYILRNK